MLADVLSLASEWQQVSSSLLDFYGYSCRSQQCCKLEWSPLFLQFLTLPAPLLSLGKSFQADLLSLISPSPSCSFFFSVLWQGMRTCPSLYKNLFLRKNRLTACGARFGQSGDGRSNPRLCGTKNRLLPFRQKLLSDLQCVFGDSN